jgi:hypothetical protein
MQHDQQLRPSHHNARGPKLDKPCCATLCGRLEKRLRPLCVRALKRVFSMCDADGDGALCDAELNAFQLVCFGMALDEAELQNVKQVCACACGL